MSNAQPTPNPNGPVVQPGAMGQEDPGKTLGIVGLVLAFVASLIGMIISIIAFRKSKAAGFNNGVAKAGIIVGAVIAVLTIGIGIAVGVMTANALGEVCAQLGSGTHQVGNTTYTCP